MCLRIAGSFLFFAALTAGALADDSSVESADALQRLFDQAMPDLLHGDVHGLDAVLKIAHPQLKRQRDYLAEQCAKLMDYRGRDSLGGPIDWKYLGVKNRGSGFRQYGYVCRYTKQPVVWRFGAQRKRALVIDIHRLEERGGNAPRSVLVSMSKPGRDVFSPL